MHDPTNASWRVPSNIQKPWLLSLLIAYVRNYNLKKKKCLESAQVREGDNGS